MLGVAGLLRAGVDEGDAGIVVDRLGVHRADDADLVGDLRGVRQQVADPLAALAALFERGEAFADGEIFLAGGHAGDALALADGVGQILAVDFVEPGLVVEEIDVRGTAGLEQIDDALRLGREVRTVLPPPNARASAASRERAAIAPMPRPVMPRKLRRVAAWRW